MKNSFFFSEDLLMRYAKILAHTMGWHFPKENFRDLEKKLRPAIHALGFEDPAQCLDELSKGNLTKEQSTVLAHHFTIGETYFFRDTSTFHALEHIILPQIIERHQNTDRRIRIWSSACCTGEEPYSLAILLHRLLYNFSSWTINLMATDINPQFLNKAQTGIYKEWSFRSTPKNIQEKYFTEKRKGSFSIIPEIRDMVKFQSINLVEESYPSPIGALHSMDLILCNNVLIYFTQKHIDQTVKQLTNTLVTGGYLIVTAIEAPYISDTRLSPLRLQGLTCFCKGASKPKESDNTPLRTLTIAKSSSKKATIPDASSDPCSKLWIELPAFLGLPNNLLSVEFSPPESSFSPQKLTNTSPKKMASSPPSQPQIDDKKHLGDHKTYENLFEKQDYQKAIDLIEHRWQAQKKPSADPKDLSTLIVLVKSYANLGKYEQAKSWCEKGLEVDTVNPLLYFLQASLLEELKLPQEALKALQRTIFLDDDFILAHFSLGNLLLRMGKSQEAKKYFRNTERMLRSLHPDQIVPHSDGITAARLKELVCFMSDKLEHA